MLHLRITLIALIALMLPHSLAAQSADADDEPKRVYVTNLGRSVLVQAELVVHGVVDRQVRKIGRTFLRKITVTKTLWGEAPGAQVSVTYLDPNTFRDRDVEVVVALRGSNLGGAYEIIGRRAALSADSTLPEVLADYIEIETTPGTPNDRAVVLAATVKRHLQEGGEAAVVARVELLLLVANYSSVLNHEYFNALRELAPTVESSVRSDIELACRGMVMLQLKSSSLVLAWKGDRAVKLSGREPTKPEVIASQIVAVDQLKTYLRLYPEAFDEADAELCEVIADTVPDQVVARLKELIREIQRVTRNRPQVDAEPASTALSDAASGASSVTLIDKQEDATGGAAARKANE